MNFLLQVIITFYLSFVFITQLMAQNTEIYYLSGHDNTDAVEWDFYCTEGRKSGTWTTIPVPSCWELQGFGKYNYGHASEEERGKEKGLYRYTFKADREWKGEIVNLIFEGSMTDTEVRINGKSAGPIHQGAFYRFGYEISKLLKYGQDNLLEVTVSKHSRDESVNDAERRADYWIFGGIFRPVFLEIKPRESIERIAIDARADGNLTAHIFLNNPKKANQLEVSLFDLTGRAVKIPDLINISLGEREQEIHLQYDGVLPWSPESPDLYQLSIKLVQDDQILHQIRERIGFRTVEIRERDGIYVNGVKIRFKGVCRHSFWPETGRTTSKSISIQDALLMKDMNMNAVRMSHYPPDPHFLDVCDSLGLFVLDELAGWQAAYATEVGKKLVREMVLRDVNHPSVVIWDNGNEGGWNTDLDDEFIKYDPQKREVIHPWEKFRKTDTNHYIDYNYGTHDSFNGSHVFFPTEFLHGLYDGGHGAGLWDFWNLMLNKPRSAGGFLWVFSDEAVVRTDLNGILDADGNHAPDGILGPHREKEGSFYAIKEIWSPVYFEDVLIEENFDGKLVVENRYHYTNLDQCEFTYQYLRFAGPDSDASMNEIIAAGMVDVPSINPGRKGVLQIDVPDHWRNSDVLYITARDPFGMEIFTWDWTISLPDKYLKKHLYLDSDDVTDFEEKGNNVYLKSGNVQVVIEKNSGLLKEVQSGSNLIPFNNGPILTGGQANFEEYHTYKEGSKSVYEAIFTGNLQKIRWIMNGNGILGMEFIYYPENDQPFYGINFSYPEKNMKGISWLGKGPYRVWKNRMYGNQVNIWHKDYNNTITGETYVYPEFKGYHASLYWVRFFTNEKPFTVYTSSENLYLRIYTPDQPRADPRYTAVDFPDGDISFLNGINAIGTKFKAPASLGPQSQLNMYQRHPTDRNLTIELFFDFR